MTEPCPDCEAMVPVCPGPHYVGHVHTDDPLCDGCMTRLRAALEALPSLYVAAYLALSTGAGNLQRVSGSRSAPLPLNEGVAVLMYRLMACVVDVVEDVAEAAHLADPVVRGRDGVKMALACRTLAAHVDTLIALPPIEHVVWTGEHDPDDGTDVWEVQHLSGVESALRIVEEVRFARVFLGHVPGRDRAAVDCPECSQRELFRRHGSETIVCDNCGYMMTWDDLERWTLMRAGTIVERKAV